MGRYNLLDEKWISVIVNEEGNSEKVSLKDVFENAHNYVDLAGDTETQDFAVLRVLLAVVQTVFSRLDAEGNPYDFIELDDFNSSNNQHENRYLLSKISCKAGKYFYISKRKK